MKFCRQCFSVFFLSITAAGFVLVTPVALAQDESQELPATQSPPAVTSSQEGLNINRPVLWAYAVVATDGAARCDQLQEERREGCEGTVSYLMMYKFLATGDCGKFRPASMLWTICVAHKNKNCVSLKDPMKIACEALTKTGDVNERITMVKDAYDQFEGMRHSEDERDSWFKAEAFEVTFDEFVKGFAVMAGYLEPLRERRKNVCEAYRKAYAVGDVFQESFFICSVLFGDNPQVAAAAIDRDLGLYNFALRSGDHHSCSRIEDASLREACGR